MAANKSPHEMFSYLKEMFSPEIVRPPQLNTNSPQLVLFAEHVLKARRERVCVVKIYYIYRMD